MKLKIENWNGYKIRFVEKESDDWWAVAKDVLNALGLSNVTNALKRLEPENYTLINMNILEDNIKNITHKNTENRTLNKNKGTKIKVSEGINREINIINEFGIYDLVFTSHKKEAKEFKKWVFSVLKKLRKSSELEGFQIFRMLDKEIQKEAMNKLYQGLKNPVKVNFIKANSIANKAVSTMYGHSKMIKKEEMTPEMLVSRQPILEDTVNLMLTNNSFDLGLSVSQTVYLKYNSEE